MEKEAQRIYRRRKDLWIGDIDLLRDDLDKEDNFVL